MLSYMVHKVCKILSTWTINKIQRRILNKRYLNIKMTTAHNARWAFNVKNWEPSEEDILLATSCIQPEEKQRISRFVFQEDAKSSLIGRLMLKKFIHLSTSIPYELIRLGRDGHGKPFLIGAGDTFSSFNVSHQGDYVVLAGNVKKNIGIDMMKIEPPSYKDIPEFFRLMNRQFSSSEWKTIYSFKTEMEQIACFYRLWCLKESYVKNTGFGLTVPLQDLSFELKTLTLEVGKFISDTNLYERGVLKHDWIFEETLLDEKYVVAVSIDKGTADDLATTPYWCLTFEDLMKEVKPMIESDVNFSKDFMKKKLKSASMLE